MRTPMTTTTRPAATCALDLNHRIVNVSKSKSHRRTLRVFPRRKVVSSPPVLPSLTNAAAAESAAAFASGQLIPDLPEQRTYGYTCQLGTSVREAGDRRQRRHNCGGNSQ